MATYTVHEPRPRKGQSSTQAERFVFVRDGFYFWAFVLGPIWMLWHRMWLVLLAYVAVLTAVEVGFWAVGASFGMKARLRLRSTPKRCGPEPGMS